MEALPDSFVYRRESFLILKAFAVGRVCDDETVFLGVSEVLNITLLEMNVVFIKIYPPKAFLYYFLAIFGFFCTKTSRIKTIHIIIALFAHKVKNFQVSQSLNES